MTPEDIVAARWFRSKHRVPESVSDVDRARLETAELVIVDVRFADGGPSERYFLPSIAGREPVDGEGAWSSLAGAIAAGSTIHGERGAFTPLDVSAGLARELFDGGSDERRLAVEQSNTSVVIGDRHLLKVYRLLEPGVSPDLEVGTALMRAGFTETPAVAGGLMYQAEGGPPMTAAMVQAFVPSLGDAWGVLRQALRADPGDAIDTVTAIGRTTADLHAALRSIPENPDFPARAATVAETATWRADAERQLALAVGSLRGEAHDALVALAPTVRERFADAFGSASGDALVSRIHGDYHLGQLLARDDGGFSVIDFEGEPARPPDERRRPASPLRDVAGMLRSLDYAARTVARDGDLDPDAWLADARPAFLDACGRIGSSEAALIEAFELEKACYEVRYEAANRPDWLWLPLGAVERLVS
jgi:maltokinase